MNGPLADSGPVRLHYEHCGSGPPVIILHGLFGSVRNWRSVARRLSESFSVYVVDMRNHGKSPRAAAMGYDVLAADVAFLIRNLGLGDATIIGHSMGGKAAMTLALHHPQLLAKLVVVDIAPSSYGDRYQDLIGELLDLDLSSIGDRRAADRCLKTAIPDDGMRLFLLQSLVFEGGRAQRWELNLPVLRDAIPEIVGDELAGLELTFDGAAYFIRGGMSERVAAGDLPTIRRLFPHARIKTIDGAGHWPHIDKPKAFLAVLTEILRHAGRG
jgi:pimeloyl-ACP methyl ester carboxylesterase